MRPVHHDIGREVAGVQVDRRDETNDPGVAQDRAALATRRNALRKPLVGGGKGDRAITVVGEGIGDRASVPVFWMTAIRPSSAVNTNVTCPVR
jgi:hypothetical protein